METKGVVGYEFAEYFKNIPFISTLFKGVVSINQIPAKIELKHFIIINLSPSDEPGSHWVTLFRSEKNNYELFNSLGFQNLNVIEKYFKFRHKAVIEFNESAFQSPTSSSCGLFCIYFAIHRCLNYDQNFSICLEDSFDSNREKNENKVKVFCENLKLHPHDPLLFP